MSLDKELMQQVRGLDVYDLRRLIIFVKGLLVQKGVAAEPGPHAKASDQKIGYRLQSVKCGKRGCTTCPHGPYWYAYWREEGKLRSRYIGRKLPAGVKT